MSYFGRIVPCGLDWARITSMERETGKSMEMEEVKSLLAGKFCETFGYDGFVAGEEAAVPAEGRAGARRGP